MQHLRWFARGKTDFDFERKSSFFEKYKSIFTDLLGNWVKCYIPLQQNVIIAFNGKLFSSLIFCEHDTLIS